MPIQAELSRVRVKPGKSQRVDEWMAFLNANMDKTLLTLADEKMYVETIFREVLDGVEYLYWYSLQGSGGQEVESSDHELDRQHLLYWKECIDPNYPMMDMKTQVLMVQEPVWETIQELEQD